MGVLDFFGRETGQRRRAALDEFGRSLEQYVPPGLRPAVGLLGEMTPNRANERAAMASDRMFQPDRTVGQRVGDFGEMASEVAGVVAPVAVAGRAGMPAAEALQEALMGVSAGSQQAGRAVVDRLNQPGPVPTMYSNPLMGGAKPSRPLNPSEQVAKDVLGLRAAGRAGDVTDEMMAQADTQYMFANTPLPMDEASRIARRDAMYGKDRFHGSNMDFQGFSGNVFTSDNPIVASTYNRGMLDAQIYPVVTREGPMGTVAVEGGLSNWNQLLPEMIDDPVIARELDRGMPISTRDIERQAAFEGRSGVTFKDINDLGPGFNSQKFKGIGYSPEESEKLRREYLEELSVPSEVDVRLSPNLVRSRFARFDPEFRHLRNLSAGVAGGGLLATQDDQQQREDEIRQYLEGLL